MDLHIDRGVDHICRETDCEVMILVAFLAAFLYHHPLGVYTAF